MSSRSCSALALAALGAALLVALPGSGRAQAEPPAGTPAAPPTAMILQREVDAAIRSLHAAAGENGALGSCRETAMALTAAGHSHRYYHIGDGPWVRRAVESLFLHRRGDGSFADDAADDGIDTTRWVLDALAVISPDGGTYRTELAAGRAFLEARGSAASSPFAEQAQALLEQSADTPDRIAALEQEARSVLGARSTPGITTAEQLVLLVCCQAVARGDFDAPPRPPSPAADLAIWLPTQERGFAFLLSQQQQGVFGVEHGGQRYPDVGLTGIGLAALQTKPGALRSGAEMETIEQGLSWLLAAQNDDGSFGQNNVNYSTCAAVMALAAAGEPRFEASLQHAQEYILLIQNTEQRQYGPGDRDYGSIGYGGDERGDLSNLQFALEALDSTGLDRGNEAYAKAMVFLQRTQNLRSHNDFTGRSRSSEDGTWYQVAAGDDGGSAYYPGNSPAGYLELPGGTRIPRSYGSMTYALLKAYTLCGIEGDDPRVLAAVRWIESNWTLEMNPGVDPALGEAAAYQGLYYYFMVMAQALDLAGIDGLRIAAAPRVGTDPPAASATAARTVDWRSELSDHLAHAQRTDGSWLNEQNGRWWEDQPLVCTVYAMLALRRCARSTASQR